MLDQDKSIIGLMNSTATGLQKPSSIVSQGGKEHRSVPRFRVKWRATAFVDEQNQHHGYIKDISVKGAAILLERNLQSLEFVKLHIQIPPSHTLREPRILKAHSKIAYSTHDSNELQFRIGVTFLKFGSDQDLVFLETFLANHHTKIA